MNSSNLIIIIVLTVILIPAIRGAYTHMKGEGSCCGGPKEKPVRKKIAGKPKYKLNVSIEGMMCDNCKNRVERALDELDGVVAKVKLSRKMAVVEIYEDIDENLIKSTVEKAGYEVVGIKKA